MSCAAELVNLLDPFERARSGASPVIRLPAERHEHVQRLIVELHAETHAERMHGQLVQKSLLGLVLAEVTRAASVAPLADPQPSLGAEALRFIERQCLEPISLSDVARPAPDRCDQFHSYRGFDTASSQWVNVLVDNKGGWSTGYDLSCEK